MSNDLGWIVVIAYGIATIVAPGLFIAALLASALEKWRKSTRLGVKAIALTMMFALLWTGQVIAPSAAFQPFMIIACIVMPVVAVILGIHAVSCRLDERQKRAERATASLMPQE